MTIFQKKILNLAKISFCGAELQKQTFFYFFFFFLKMQAAL